MLRRLRGLNRGKAGSAEPVAAGGSQHLSWHEISGIDWIPNAPSHVAPRAGIVTQQALCSPDFYFWTRAINEHPTLHRKQWEYFLALQTVWASTGGDLSGKRAIFFGVGLDPIPALLASLGAEVLVTDYRSGPNSEAWRNTGQLSENLLELNSRALCPDDVFEEKCSYREVDMNQIPVEFEGEFDFVFSFCSLGHIGGYQKGLDFIIHSGSVLRPGGVAVHTTEIDLSGHLRVLESPDLSLYRRADLERTLKRLTEEGFQVPEHRFHPGPGFADQYLDKEPFSSTHLRHDVLGHETTAFGFVFSRNQ